MRVSRVVCDTNVLISAVIMPEGKARAAVDSIIRNARILVSTPLFDELRTRLQRKKFDRYVTPAERAAFLSLLLTVQVRIDIAGDVLGVRDPADDMILETALVGEADFLVTGDGDLLALRPCGEKGSTRIADDARYRGVAILRPAEYLSLTSLEGR